MPDDFCPRSGWGISTVSYWQLVGLIDWIIKEDFVSLWNRSQIPFTLMPMDRMAPT